MSIALQYIKKENPSENDINTIRNGLRTYNRKYWGDTKNIPYVIKIQAENESVIGGAFFYVFGNWLELWTSSVFVEGQLSHSRIHIYRHHHAISRVPA